MKTLEYDIANPKKALADLKAAILADAVMDELVASMGDTFDYSDGEFRAQIERALSTKIWEVGI